MVRLFIGLGVVALGLLIYCAVECLQSPKHRVRALSKPAWLAIILLLPLIGGVLWMAFGRPQRQTPQQRRSGPRAPDDDPDFLRQIQIQRRQQQRREEEARKKAEQDKNDRAAASGDQPSDAPEQPEAESPGETPSDDDPHGTSEENTDVQRDAAGEELDPDDPRRDAFPGSGPAEEDPSEDDGEEPPRQSQ